MSAHPIELPEPPLAATDPAAWVPRPEDSAEVRLAKAREYMRMVGRMNRRLRRLTAHLFSSRSITRPQYLVLLWVKNRAGLTQGELAAIVDSDANTVSSLVRRLEQKALLIRSRDPADRRAYRLRVTPKGAQWVDKIRRRVDVASLQFYSLLPAGHEAAIAEWLTKAARYDRPV
jgi:DNA-binding MarR family transcriptional regulator